MPFVPLYREAPLLTGTLNYITWSHDMQILLKLLHLWTTASGVRMRPHCSDAAATYAYEVDLLQISGLIFSKLDVSLRTEYAGEKWDDGARLWKTLEHRFGPAGAKDCNGVLGGYNVGANLMYSGMHMG